MTKQEVSVHAAAAVKKLWCGV